eukprot:1142995-Amphidinium_carterae.1
MQVEPVRSWRAGALLLPDTAMNRDASNPCRFLSQLSNWHFGPSKRKVERKQSEQKPRTSQQYNMQPYSRATT